MLDTISEKKPKKTKVNYCDACEKEFHDKSTLNRHIKRIHRELDDKDLRKSPENKTKNGYAWNLVKNIALQKSISWNETVEIKQIPTTKASPSKLSNDIVKLFDDCESIMILYTKRNQYVPLSKLIELVTSKTNEEFNAYAYAFS